MKDPIIDQIHKIRDKHAKRFNYDLKAICEDLKKIEKTCGHKVISLPPKLLVNETDC